MSEKTDIRTDFEKARDARREVILNRYRELRRQYPFVKRWRLARVIAGEMGRTPAAVVNVIKTIRRRGRPYKRL